MGEERLRLVGSIGLLVLSLAAGLGHARAAGASHFASYDRESDCVAARTFPAGACRIAFANARSEYESKTPSFASAAACAQHYTSCMVWPPGGGATAVRFRPTWDGVDIVDTPTERSVTPAPGSAAGKAVRFAARPLTEEPAPLVIRGATIPVPPPRGSGAPLLAGRPSPAGAIVRRAGGAPEKDVAPSAPPPPGSGFRLEDGVLTYPAPARFQPRNLPKP